MITPATENDYPVIIEVWELSVRATHHFLPEDYLREIKAMLPAILSQVSIYLWRDEKGILRGFAGVGEQKIEMLFIHPSFFRKGLGRRLTEFCIHTLKTYKVDVNEQNEQAVGFYKKMGFLIIGREERDSLDRPYPLLLMQYSQ